MLMWSQRMREQAKSVNAAEQTTLICTEDERETLKCKYILNILWSWHEYNVMQQGNSELEKGGI